MDSKLSRNTESKSHLVITLPTKKLLSIVTVLTLVLLNLDNARFQLLYLRQLLSI